VADSGEDGIGSIAGGCLEIAAAEIDLGFYMADHGLDGGAAAQLALDDTEHAALPHDNCRQRRLSHSENVLDFRSVPISGGALACLDP
jgi:hypothetical protein